jgi:hypothetical protein
MADSSFFNAYLSSLPGANTKAAKGGQIYPSSLDPTQPLSKKQLKSLPTITEKARGEFGFSTDEYATGRPTYSDLLKRAVETGVGGIEKVKGGEDFVRGEAPGRASYLSSQVRSGTLSPQEAAAQFEAFGTAYQVPGTYETTTQLSQLQRGKGPSGEQYRPFTQTASQLLGLGKLNPEQMKGYEQAAQAMGKTGSPEAFSQFLGQALMASPEYIRKTPLAFTANLPFEGKYGVPYQKDGAVTGNFRFRPPSFA